MTKYVVRKLDFGYLTKIKKKILYLNYFNRIIRFKNNAGLRLKKNFKILINKVSAYSKLKHLRKSKFINILKPNILLNTNFNCISSRFRVFDFNIKSVSFKIRFKNYNYIKNFYIRDIKKIIRKKIKKYIKSKKKIIKKILKKVIKNIEGIHNKHFKNKYVKLKIKLKRKIKKFFKCKGRGLYKQMLEEKKKIKMEARWKMLASIRLKRFEKMTQFWKNKKINKTKNTKKNITRYTGFKKKKKCNIDFTKSKLNAKNKKKTQKQKRQAYVLSIIKTATKRNKNIEKNKIISYFLRTQKLSLKKNKKIGKLKIVLKCNKYITQFRNLLRKNYKYLLEKKFKGSKFIFKYLKSLVKNTKKKRQKRFKLKIKKRQIIKKKKVKRKFNFKLKPKNFVYISIRVRKLKIKYYISKIYIVASKYIKNIVSIRGCNLQNFFNISLVNINRYSNLYSQVSWVKFFFNFIFFYFFKYCKIKGISKSKSIKRKKFKNNNNILMLDRPLKRTKITHIFETQNSFFFLRFIRLSKKILDLFLPIKQKYIKDNNLSLRLKKKIIYYKFLITETKDKINLNSNYYQFNNINNNNSIIKNIFYLILSKVIKKKENILFVN